MKHKKILILLIILLLTGCSANYDLTINADSSVEEKVTIQIEDTDDNFNKASNVFKENNALKSEYKILRNNDSMDITYSKKYMTVEDYILNSNIYKQLTDEIDIQKTKSETELKTTIDFSKNDISINNDRNTNFDYLQINIDSKLPVISENSDTINQNNYTWIYNGKQLEKNINIKFNNAPKVITVKAIVLLSLMIISLLSMSYIIYRRFKQRQAF